MLTPHQASSIATSNKDRLMASIPFHIADEISKAAEGGHFEARVEIDPDTTIVSDLEALGYSISCAGGKTSDSGNPILSIRWSSGLQIPLWRTAQGLMNSASQPSEPNPYGPGL